MATASFTAPEISCMGCVGSIQRALGTVPGVLSVTGNAETKLVTVEYEASQITPAELLEHLDTAGFPATLAERA